MTTKEKNEHLINKWKFMIEPLDNKKTSQTRFAKMFEHTALHSDTHTLKLVLPLLQRALYALPSIKASTSIKNSLSLGEFEKDLVIDNGIIMPDGASAFIDYMTRSFIEKFESGDIEKINHFRLTEKPNNIEVSVIY